MKLRTLLVAGLFAAVCSAPVIASAQTAPAATPVDPERLALAHQLLDEMNMKQMFHGILGKMFEAMPMKSAPGFDMRQFGKSMGAGFESAVPEFEEIEAKAYADTFTADELRGAVAFYGSPSGKALLAKLPELTAKMTPAIYAVMPKVFAVTDADYCKHVQCSTEMKDGFRREEDMIAKVAQRATAQSQH
ncbi:MAG TPA: DUF2059 domain-containing protein [Caulobacteraceae bacterium]|jgi:hypothetical protein|nr:DUF2059 domain-containing protein [Caulobacteraceae bacterium]